jgi:hypothetical protein
MAIQRFDAMAHCNYLLGTLIPDCIESGSMGHAQDHALTVYFLALACLCIPEQTKHTEWSVIRDKAEELFYKAEMG